MSADDERSDPRQCECLYDCGNCTRSGYEWHTHSGEDCPLHPEAPVS